MQETIKFKAKINNKENKEKFKTQNISLKKGNFFFLKWKFALDA